MTHVARFTFNPFQENTYVLYDESKECIIFDPGCYTPAEQSELSKFIEKKALNPVRLINTHCHIDHVFGNAFIMNQYALKPECHKDELPVLQHAVAIGEMYGTPVVPSPEPVVFLDEGDLIEFGDTRLEVFYTPGHSPASLSFFCRKDGFLIAGDVLFQGSIGRTDLPGGNYDTLIDSIKNKLFPLPDKTIVYPGHGPETTIGYEKTNNPFVGSTKMA